MSQLTDEILSQIDIVDVVSSHVKLKRAGKNFLWLCPFHHEKTPSFTVAPDKQIFKCFWCGQGGNVITFVQEIERIDFWEACKILCKQAHIDITQYYKSADQYQAKTTEKEQSKLINASALSFFQTQLGHSQVALSYLHDNRSLSDADILNRSIGYAPAHYDQLITYLHQQWYNDQEIIASGLAKQGVNGGLYSMFRHRIMFAIYDHIGNIVGFAGRALDPDDSPKYLNIAETSLYNKSNILYGLHRAKQHITALKHLVIVEWYMDVIGLSKFGLPIGVATCGTSMTTSHIKLLKRYQATIVCAFDNDQAWFQAMVRSLGMFYSYDIYPQVLILPDGIKDIDEWQKKEADSDQVMTIDRFLTYTKEGFGAFVHTLIHNHDIHNPIQRKLIIGQIFDLLKHVADYSVVMLYITQIADTLQIDQTLLFNQYKTHLKGQTFKTLPSHSAWVTPYSQDILMASLVLENYMHKLSSDPQVVQIYQLIWQGLQLLQDNRISTLITDQHTEILTAQMWRDRQLLDHDQPKKTQYLVNFLLAYAQSVMRQVMKSTSDPHTKQMFVWHFQSLLKYSPS